MKVLKYLIFLLGLITLSCGNNQKEEKPGETFSSIEVITDTDLKQIIAERDGKVLFLNVWATWCVPCVEEFPDIVKLSENYKNKEVEVIAISVDLPSEIESKIKPFLKDRKTGFKVYVAEDKGAEKIINMLNTEWSGAIPASFVFDKEGKQQKFLLGAQSYNDMSGAVESINSL